VSASSDLVVLDVVKHKSGQRRLRDGIIPEEAILRAVAEYVPLDCFEEARSLYYEAQSGNKVAQFIVGMALRKQNYAEVGETWLQLSADQGFDPARQQLKKAG
jgi:hypothetical protein